MSTWGDGCNDCKFEADAWIMCEACAAEVDAAIAAENALDAHIDGQICRDKDEARERRHGK